MQKKTFQTFLFMSVLFFGGIFTQEKVRGAEEYETSLNCGFSQAIGDVGVPLMLERGTVPAVLCEVTNMTKEKTFSVFVWGEQVSAGTPVASSGTNITVGGEATASGKISFPAVSQNGQYDYVFKAVDTKTGQIVANQISLKVIVGGGAELEKVELGTEYQQGDAFDMTVFLKASKPVIAPDTFFLRVALVTKDGEECVVLEDGMAVTGATMKLSLNFPPKEQCANTLRVSLRDADEKVIDQEFVVVGASQGDMNSSGMLSLVQSMVASIPKIFWIFLALTGVLMFALVGYHIVRKRNF